MKNNKTYVFDKKRFLRHFGKNIDYWLEEDGKIFWSPKERVYIGWGTYCTSDEALVFPKELKISEHDYKIGEVKNFIPACFYKYYVEV